MHVPVRVGYFLVHVLVVVVVYRDMFTANFKGGREREAQLCVYVGERRVVDLWGSATGDKACNQSPP